jgi:hypothetical protein
MIIPVPFAQVNWRFRGLAAPHGAEVTLGLNVDIFPGTPADACVECRDAWVARIRPLQCNQIELEEVLVKFGPNSVGPSAVLGSSLAGSTASDTDPPHTALLVQKVTGVGGRAGRGRFYWPGFRTTLFDSSGLGDPAQIGALQTAFNGFHTDLVTAGLVPTLLHGPSSPITTPIPITSFQVSGTAATQRRRLRR